MTELHHKVRIVETNSHALRTPAEEWSCQFLRLVAESGSGIGNDDRWSFREIGFDAHVNCSARQVSVFFRPANPQPEKRVVEQIVECSESEPKNEIRYDVPAIFLKRWTVKSDMMLAKPDAIDVADPANQPVEADRPAGPFA